MRGTRSTILIGFLLGACAPNPVPDQDDMALADLKAAPDLFVAVDLSVPPDMSVPPDLSPVADLRMVPDLLRRCGANALGITPDPVDFTKGNPIQVKLTNYSNCVVHVNAIQIAGMNVGDFSLTGAPQLPGAMAGGSSIAFTVRFQGVGHRMAILSFATDVGTISVTLRS